MPYLEALRLRDIAIVRTLGKIGMRVAELCGLRRGDLQPSTRRAIVTGKGDKGRFVYFDDAAWDAVAAYLAARDRATRSVVAVAEQPVFAAQHYAKVRLALPATTNGVRDLLRDLAAEAGQAQASVTPHRFRAWFATHMLEETGDLAAVQDFMGHESPATTRVYTRVATRRMRALHDKAFATAT
jgi:site-specific recombinase XerD